MFENDQKGKIEILRTVLEYVKDKMQYEETGHDWWHIFRVYKLSNQINEKERKDDFIVKMIALLHDLYDDKISSESPKEKIPKLLKELGVLEKIREDELNNILNSVANLGYKGGFNEKMLSPEGQIVQDADRIDAIGAIGIARVFTYGGKKGRPIFDPKQGIVTIDNEEEYRNMNRHSINHFYEKLLKIKDTMNTETGKRIAIERTEYMQQFLDEFYKEWYGEENYHIKGLDENKANSGR